MNSFADENPRAQQQLFVMFIAKSSARTTTALCVILDFTNMLIASSCSIVVWCLC
eukprot:m.17336 g.17336  ORF g.17336 m.17336 type:complete len:55 (-) comp7409_c0_seq1:112-276(-)